jgi:hypothetical protein
LALTHVGNPIGSAVLFKEALINMAVRP